MTDNYRRHEMEARQREIAYQNGYADGKEDTRGQFERLESAFKQHLKDAGEIQKTQAKGMSKLQAEIERLRAALRKLRDCDWVITLPDRMDAVRDIAKEALGDA